MQVKAKTHLFFKRLVKLIVTSLSLVSAVHSFPSFSLQDAQTFKEPQSRTASHENPPHVLFAQHDICLTREHFTSAAKSR